MVAIVLPILWMLNDPSPHHIQININHAANQVFIGIHCRDMIAVFPKGSMPLFGIGVPVASVAILSSASAITPLII